MKKSVIIVLAAAMLALALVACSSGGGSGSAAEGVEGTNVQQVSASAVKVTLGSSSESAQATITVAQGESYIVASSFDSGEAEVVLQYPNGDSTTDYAYEGYGCSETEVDPGSYTVTVNPTDATGTMYVLAYAKDQLDFDNSDSEALFAQIAKVVG